MSKAVYLSRMTNNHPTIDELRDSFNRVYQGPDRLQREYDLVMEAELLGVPLDTYRQLYELRWEEAIAPYPRPKKWWCAPGDWGKWIWHLPLKKKIALGRKGVVKLVQSGVIVTVALSLGRYVWEAPKREKLAHYEAWQMINSATGQKTSGGRIDALQDLVKDKVSLQGLNTSGANLEGIKLQNADLRNANFHNAILRNANLIGASLRNAVFDDVVAYNNKVSLGLFHGNYLEASLHVTDLRGAKLRGADLRGAIFGDAELRGADLRGAVLSGADFTNTNLVEANLDCFKSKDTTYGYCTDFKGAKHITPQQIKQAKNWQTACYDPDFRIKLGLPPQNPKQCVGDEPSK